MSRIRPETLHFKEWLPDQGNLDNPGCLIAENVIPQIRSFRYLPSLGSFTNALTSAALGYFWLQDSNSAVYNFVGDTDSLYQLSGGSTWSDVSGASAPYGVDSWEFTKFGDRVIAAGYQTDLQYFDVGVSSAFADLPGSPPRGRRIATVRDFIVLGDTDINGGGGSDTTGPNFIQWSAFNNTELWTPSLATLADYQELHGRGGRVQRIVPGEYGVIFQEHSLQVMTQAPPPLVFQIDEVENARGTPAPGSVVWAGKHVFYYGWDSFYYFDGRTSKAISANRVSKWFRDNADASSLDTMTGVFDRRNRLVMWGFRSNAGGDINDRVLIYNWGADKWSYAIIDTELLAEYASSGLSLDDLDIPLPGGIDDDSIPVDSDQFKGGALNVLAFNSSHEAAGFTGTDLTARLVTKEVAASDGRNLFVNSVQPLVESDNPDMAITVQVGSRDNLGADVALSAARNLNTIGEANVRNNSRYQRYQLNITGSFQHAIGVCTHMSVRRGRR